MAGKTGKNGRQSGRTVRSPYSRVARREGILVKKVRQTTKNSEENPPENLVETISYSLGKQNRWLMPEAIQNSGNPREVVGEESDFVLVEQRGVENGRRRRCISVYESSTKKIRKPRRRYAESQSLRSGSSQTDLEFEVQYPVPKNSWPLNSEVKYSEKNRWKGKRCSVNRRGKWSVMAELDGYFSEEDEEYVYGDDDDEDFHNGDDDGNDDDEDDSNDHSLYTLSLGEYLENPAKQPSLIQRQSSDKAVRGQNQCSFKNNIIIINDRALIDEHERLLANARVQEPKNESKKKKKRERNKSKKRKKRERIRALRRLPALVREDKNESDVKTKEPSTEDENYANKKSDFPCHEVCLQEKEIIPSELQKTWGENYSEGGCDPRKFAIDLTGLMKSTPKHINLAVMVILFELEKSQVKMSDVCKASVKLVLDGGLSDLNYPHELIMGEFLDLLSGNGSEACSVGKIINDVVRCIEKYVILKSDQKALKTSEKNPFYSLDVFTEVLGYKGRSCTEREVFVQAKKELMKNREAIKPEDIIVSRTCTTQDECGICFEDLNNEGNLKHTTLVSCGHSFCNSCWEVYIRSVLKMGGTELLCPGHQCQTSLDDITIMSLATSWYGKYFSWKIKRSITKNLSMKHCPSERCCRLMQVTPSEGQKAAMKSTTAPLPVVCPCNQSWCFKCQEPAHWPSQCEEAQEFREEYKDKVKRITSVMVKKCPTCRYPIEKFYGCDNMFCIFCKIYFCWQCLSGIRGHNYYECQRRVIAENKVKLPEVPKSKLHTLTDIALSSQRARKSTKIIAVQKRLKSMQKGIDAYCYLKTSRALKNTHHSQITSIMEGMVKHNTVVHVKDALNFKYQAHVVLEGLAITLVKGDKCDITLQNDLTRLVFLTEGLDNFLKNPCSVCNEETVNKLMELIERGKLCIRDIKRHVKK